MTEQGRRTRSPRSSLQTQALGIAVPVHPSTPQLRRAMPREVINSIVVPPMPGDSPGVPVDVDVILAAAVETEFFYKPALDHYEAASDALRKEVSESSRNVATLVAELRLADHRARHIETVAVATCKGLRDEDHHRVLQESAALLHHSQDHELNMASQLLSS